MHAIPLLKDLGTRRREILASVITVKSSLHILLSERFWAAILAGWWQPSKCRSNWKYESWIITWAVHISQTKNQMIFFHLDRLSDGLRRKFPRGNKYSQHICLGGDRRGKFSSWDLNNSLCKPQLCQRSSEVHKNISRSPDPVSCARACHHSTFFSEAGDSSPACRNSSGPCHFLSNFFQSNFFSCFFFCVFILPTTVTHLPLKAI